MSADQIMAVSQSLKSDATVFAKTGLLVAALLIHIVAALTIGIQPLLVQGYVDVLHFSAEQAGYLAAAENAGLACGAVVLAMLGSRLSLRGTLLGASALLGLASLASALTTSYGLFFGWRLFAGIGAGMIISLIYSVFGKTPKADRNFGLALATMMISSSAMFAILPTVMAAFGLYEIFLGFAVAPFLIVAATFYLPRQLGGNSSGSAAAVGRVDRGWILALMAMMVYFVALGSIWAYLYLVGTQAGISSEAVGGAMSWSNLFGIAGASATGWIAAKLSRPAALALSILGTAGPLLLLNGQLSEPMFVFAVCGFGAFQNMSHPMLLGTMSRLDGSGRLTIWAASVQMIGFAVGPAIGAAILGVWSYPGVIWSSVGLFSLCFLLIFLAVRCHTATR